MVTRDTNDLEQVASLKDVAYRPACEEFVEQTADS